MVNWFLVTLEKHSVGALLFLGPFTWSGLIQMERNKLNLKEDPRVHQVLEQHLENIESLAIHQTYTNWKLIKSMGLGRREAPAYVINRERHSYWGRIQQVMLIMAVAGAILIARFDEDYALLGRIMSLIYLLGAIGICLLPKGVGGEIKD